MVTKGEEQPMRDVDLLSIIPDRLPDTVEVHLQCGKCGHTGRFLCNTVCIDPKAQEESATAEDYVTFDAYIRCAKCASSWPWVFMPEAYLALSALMAVKMAGVDDPRLMFGSATMFDGTRPFSAAQAEDHLLDILKKEPQNAFVWSRLGNTYRRAALFKKAAEAYGKALELDPDDIESHYGRGMAAFHQGRYKESEAHLHRFMILARENKSLPEEFLRDLAMSALETLCEASARTNGKVKPVPSYRPDKIEPSDKPVTINIETFDLSKESHRERVVDMVLGKPLSSAARSRPEPDPPRKIGRNDPCPCGSGRKYKKCCGR
jgi:hypothetical protein